MDPTTGKRSFLNNILVRILSFVLLLLLILRSAYVVTVDFYFFPDTLKLSASTAAVSTKIPLQDLWTSQLWRKSVDYYSSIFQDLISDGYLSPDSKALCIETLTGQDVFALREIGVVDSIGFTKKASPPLVVSRMGYRQPFDDNTFDFEFSGGDGLDRSIQPHECASEIKRTLKPGGFFVAHTAVSDGYGFHSFLQLFEGFILVRSRDIDGFHSPSIREVIMKKEKVFLGLEGKKVQISSPHGKTGKKCTVPGFKRELIRNAEPLIEEEPLKPWITLKRNIRNVKYLSSMVDIRFKRRYVYVDVGARSYGSSIGSWFKKQYPKQNKTFEIYAIEADKDFHDEYRTKKGVTLLPQAAWVRNETLFFGISREPSKKSQERIRGMGRIQPVQSSANFMGDMDKIQGFDFAHWLKNTVSEKDFLVMKMDVEGTEFHLIPRLIETGAICLVDEVFLECHYNRWQQCCPGERSSKYQKTYSQCLDMFSSLRESGVLVHQWW